MSSRFRSLSLPVLAAVAALALTPAAASADGALQAVGAPTIVERIDGSAAKASPLGQLPEAPTRAFARAAAQPTSVTRVAPGSTPAGFVSLSTINIPPTPIAEEQLFNFATPEFRYDGAIHDELGVTSNGTLIVGGGTDKDLVCCNPVLGSTGRPNGVIAPFWTDLEPTALRLGYVAPTGSPPGERPVWVVAEWEAKDFGTSTVRKFQVWIQSSDPDVTGPQVPPAQSVSLTYDFTTMTAEPAIPFAVGAENLDGTSGDQLPGLPTQDLVVSFLTPNAAPVAVGDAYAADEGIALSVAAPGLLDNDSDADGDPLGAELVSGPSNGTLTAFPGDGQFTYVPAAGFSGQDTFTYRVTDARGASARATVTITVVPRANTVPSVTADAFGAVEDTPLIVAAPGLLANDSDGEGDPMTATVADAAAHGTLGVAADGSFIYTPNAGYVGTDRFGYRASDGRGESVIALVSITVARKPNGVPLARGENVTTDQGERLRVAAPGVLRGDSDPDGDPLTAVLADAPANGTVALQPDGSFAYTPDDDFAGRDRFGYRASDGRDASAVAWVVIDVEAPDEDEGDDPAPAPPVLPAGGGAASSTLPPGGAGAMGADLAAPLASLFRMPLRVRMTTLAGRGFAPRVSCDEACSVTARMHVRRRGAQRDATILHTKPTPRSTGIHVVPVRVAMVRLRNMSRPRTATLVVSVTDATGNRRTLTRVVQLR